MNLFTALANDFTVVLLLDFDFFGNARDQIVNILLDHGNGLVDTVARALDLDDVGDLFALLEDGLESEECYKTYLWSAWERDLNTTTVARDFVDELGASLSELLVVLFWDGDILLLDQGELLDHFLEHGLGLVDPGSGTNNGDNVLFGVVWSWDGDSATGFLADFLHISTVSANQELVVLWWGGDLGVEGLEAKRGGLVHQGLLGGFDAGFLATNGDQLGFSIRGEVNDSVFTLELLDTFAAGANEGLVQLGLDADLLLDN